MQTTMKKNSVAAIISEEVRKQIAESTPVKTGREIRRECTLSRIDAAQRLIDSGMTRREVADTMDRSISWVQKFTTMSDEQRHASEVKRALYAREVHHKNFLARKAYWSKEMNALRAQGYNNSEIAQKTGFCPESVYRYIGNQPDEISLMSIRVAGAKRRLRRRAVINTAAREKAERASNIIPMTAKED